MKNIKTAINGQTLTITVDLAKTFGPSKSGKTEIIASSEGNITPEGAPAGLKIGLNIYRPRAGA